MLLTAALLATLPTAAYAQATPRTDPEVGSPAEAVYGIPLEEARRDAAPRIRPGTAIRTELGVGSSARIPGLRPPPGEADPVDAERERKRRRQAARAAERISGEPTAAATAAVVVLVVGIAAAGGVGAGRLAGRRARL